MKLKLLILRGTFYGNPQIVLLLRLGIVLFFMSLSRILLYWFNVNLFPSALPKIAYYTYSGLRFDLVALVYTNLLYIFLMSIPFRFRRSSIFIKSSNILFYISNSLLLLPNFIDIIYYRFTLKRLTAEIFTLVSSQIDIFDLLPAFLIDFWFIPALWIGFVILLIFTSSKIQISRRYVMQPNISYYLSQLVVFFLALGLSVLGMRGGIQLKPLSILHVSQYTLPNNAAIVLNSAFTIMRSTGKEGVKPLHFYKSANEMKAIFNPEKRYSSFDSTGALLPMNKPNILIIILESFSSEHIGALHNKSSQESFTPFLDSLISKSITYQGYANGKRSIEGIPAIVSGLPSWMTSDIISSAYSGNRYSSIAGILKNEEYTSAFFHGGKNGTMGFDSYLIASGFDKYFGKNEYPIQSDFDGHWGIWDEPYLQYVANTLSRLKSPFCASVFTLSSHHPYSIPEKYSNKFKEGKLPIQQSIMYTDFALRAFFKKASTMPWFNNTLLVLTADHTSEAVTPFYQTSVGQYSIPIVFSNFKDTTRFQSSVTAQQTDIVPTLLDFIHYPKPFTAFGSSLLRKDEPHFSISKTNFGFQIIQSEYCLHCDDNLNPQALYKIDSDSLLQSNILKKAPKQASIMLSLIRASIQQYNYKLINNTLTLEKQ